jgi:hypothetical protein
VTELQHKEHAAVSLVVMLGLVRVVRVVRHVKTDMPMLMLSALSQVMRKAPLVEAKQIQQGAPSAHTLLSRVPAYLIWNICHFPAGDAQGPTGGGEADRARGQ